MAVSCDSITASVPSRIALATSATSARVGREAVTIESSICVAVIDGRASVPASARSFFWTMGTSWIGSSMPRSPRATMTQSAALRIDCARSTACGFSIFAMSGRRVWRRTASTSSARRTKDSATRSTPMRSPACSISRSPSGTEGRISVSPGMFSPCRDATAPPNSTSQSNSCVAGAHGGDAQADRAVGQVHDLAWIDRIGELGDRDGDLPRVAEPVLAAQERHGAAGLELRAVVAQLADAHLRAGEVLEDRDRPARGARGVAHHAGGLRVLLDGPVGEVQPRDVHARVDHAAEGLRIAGRGADGGHDLRTAHEANVLAQMNGLTWPVGPNPGRSPRPPRR